MVHQVDQVISPMQVKWILPMQTDPDIRHVSTHPAMTGTRLESNQTRKAFAMEIQPPIPKDAGRFTAVGYFCQTDTTLTSSKYANRFNPTRVSSAVMTDRSLDV